MPYVNTPEGFRTDKEAWDLALDHKGLMFKLLNEYVRKHSLPYYKGEALRAELESFAWEGFFMACKKWDESKSKLSVYAYPSIRNAMHARMKVLERMGSSMVGHNGRGQKPIRPYLNSLEQADDFRKSSMEFSDFADGFSDILPPATNQEPEPSMEDTVIDKIHQEESIAEIRRIWATMSEPHKTVFELVYLTNVERPVGVQSKGPGMNYRDVGRRYGQSTTWVRETLAEAIEYIKYQMEVTDD